MSGTFIDQSTLAETNSFISICRISLIKRAIELDAATTKQTAAEMSLYRDIIQNPDTYASKIALLIATSDAEVSSAAPAIPSDTVIQACVNTMMPYLLR
jgi:hypothetical protein